MHAPGVPNRGTALAAQHTDFVFAASDKWIGDVVAILLILVLFGLGWYLVRRVRRR